MGHGDGEGEIGFAFGELDASWWCLIAQTPSFLP